jgi:DNA-binding MarR family transcriptional regulator
MSKFVQKENANISAAECLGFAIRKAARVITQLYDEALAPVGLKSTQFSLLNVASVAEDVSINSLAEMLVMDRTTLTRNLRPLVKAGLVEVNPGIDRRTRAVKLTPAGRARLDKALPLWRTVQEQAIRQIGKNTGIRLREDLSAVVRLSQ